MKILQRIEFFVQMSAILAAALFAISSCYTYQSFTTFMAIQFCVGAEQYISSAISCLAKTSRWKAKLVHLKISSACLALLFVMSIEHASWMISLLKISFLFIIPWSLAIYYFVITWKENFQTKSDNGHFLPHTSF